MCVRLIRRAMPRTYILLLPVLTLKWKCHRLRFIPETMHLIQSIIPRYSDVKHLGGFMLSNDVVTVLGMNHPFRERKN